MQKIKKKVDLSEYPEFLHNYWYNLTLVRAKSEGTAEGYFIDIRVFLRYLIYMNTTEDIKFNKIDIRNFEVSQLENLSLNTIYEYIYFLRDELKNNERTIARKISSIKSMFKFLTKTAYILKKNPTIDLEISTPKRSLPKYLSLEESQSLIEKAAESPINSPRDYCIVTLFLNCGMRLSELVGMDITDINFDDQTARILGKGNKERIIYLNEACVKSIQEYIDSRENSITDPKALFLSKGGRRISQRRVQQIIEQLLRQCGLNGKGISVHKLRHTAATLMYKYGNVDIRTLKDVLGHESIATTQIYTHTNNQDVQNAMNSSPLANFNIKTKSVDDDKDE
ncbi:MAG: tyrosine recombinase XerC [Ruminococcus sp.]|nr:tyrosine recombinase XerC [Ruminococcus sp.]